MKILALKNKSLYSAWKVQYKDIQIFGKQYTSVFCIGGWLAITSIKQLVIDQLLAISSNLNW